MEQEEAKKQKKEAARAEKEAKAKYINMNKVKSLFRDPIAAAHLQWLIDHNGKSNKS